MNVRNIDCTFAEKVPSTLLIVDDASDIRQPQFLFLLGFDLGFRAIQAALLT